MQGHEESPQRAAQLDNDQDGAQGSQPLMASQLADEIPRSRQPKACSDTPLDCFVSRPATRSTPGKPRRASARLSQGRSGLALAAQPANITRTAEKSAAKRRCSREPLPAHLRKNAESHAYAASDRARPGDAVTGKGQSPTDKERAAITTHEVTPGSGVDQLVNARQGQSQKDLSTEIVHVQLPLISVVDCEKDCAYEVEVGLCTAEESSP